MTFRKGLMPIVDRIRGIPDTLGLRDYTVTIRVRSWSGSRPGVDNSSSSDADTTFWVDGGTHRPRVVQVTQRDIIASGGALQDQDIKVGPVTPSYGGGGVDITTFDPSNLDGPAEVLFKVEGPGMASGGSWFRKVSQDCSKSFSYFFTLRRTGETA